MEQKAHVLSIAANQHCICARLTDRAIKVYKRQVKPDARLDKEKCPIYDLIIQEDRIVMYRWTRF